MPIALEITVIVVLVAVAAALVPLLFQLRRTAKGLDDFLLSTRRDLAQLTEDVHAARLRLDHVAESAQSSMGEIQGLVEMMGDAVRKVKDFQGRFRASLDSASRYLGVAIGGIGAVLALVKHRKTMTQPKKEQSS